jgi:hypothetical protein
MKTIKNKFIYALPLFLALTFSSCNENEEIDKGTLIIEFENLLNGEPLKFEGFRYNRDEVDFNIAVLKYYISNIKFLDEGGQVIFTEPESYHLLEETSTRKELTIEISDLELQKISSIEFSIGIDPEKNLSLDNTGDLDPSNEMAWNWDTGYKFLLMEGEIFESDGNRKGMVYHIGGNENYKTINKEVKTEIKANTTTTVEIKAEVLSLFDAPHYININDVNVAMGGENADKIAENYANNFFSVITQN